MIAILIFTVIISDLSMVERTEPCLRKRCLCYSSWKILDMLDCSTRAFEDTTLPRFDLKELSYYEILFLQENDLVCPTVNDEHWRFVDLRNIPALNCPCVKNLAVNFTPRTDCLFDDAGYASTSTKSSTANSLILDLPVTPLHSSERGIFTLPSHILSTSNALQNQTKTSASTNSMNPFLGPTLLSPVYNIIQFLHRHLVE